MKRPLPNAAPVVHEKVLELCKDLAPARVLDAPAGQGALSEKLAEAGFSVEAIDINKDSFAASGENISFTKGDLNLDLPYTDGSFGCAVCVEGIEHIENIYHLLRQFARVLAPGGTLIITTPNILNMASRIKFMLFGSYRYFNSKIDTEDRSLSGHIRPVSFQELEHALGITGFNVEKVNTNTYIGVKGFLRAAMVSLCRWVNKRFNKAYNPVLCGEELLFGDITIVSARRAS